MKLTRASLVALALALPGLPACGAMSSLDEDACRPGDAPTCVAPPADDPCGAPALVAAKCETHGWECPSGARVHARAADTGAPCLPLSELPGSISAIGGWGLGGSFVRVPTDDGRCLWIAGNVSAPAGQVIHNVAIEVDRSAPFGSCPTTGIVVGGAPASIVEIEGGADPSISVQLASAVRVDGVTRVAYRLFKTDPTAVYGTTDLGGGLGRWDATKQRIVVQGPGAIAFPTTLDLGTAALASGGSAFVWGCPRDGGFLMSDCIVARLDAAGAAELFLGGASWTANLDPMPAATTGLKSGPWISSVTTSAGTSELLHVFIGGFGNSLQTQLAAGPTAAWSAPTPLVDCQLAPNDASSYCAGPMVHPELADPMRPGEVVVSYDIGSTATNQDALRSQDPAAYWPRLVWVTAP